MLTISRKTRLPLSSLLALLILLLMQGYLVVADTIGGDPSQKLIASSVGTSELTVGSLVNNIRLDIGAVTSPGVTTNKPTNITSNSAYLNGNLTSLGTAATANASFQWSSTSGNYTSETSPVSINALETFSAAVTGLSANITYYFRAKVSGDRTTYGAEMSFSTLTIPPASLVSISITPVNSLIPLGSSQQFNARGTFDDNSTATLTSIAIWTSSNASVAPVIATGLASSIAVGTANISATMDNVSGSANLTVTTSAIAEINNGDTISLHSGQPMHGSDTGGVPIDIKNINVSANATGLAAFDFTLNWNPNVIHVDSLQLGSDAQSTKGWNITVGPTDNITGTVRFVGTTTQMPYSKADFTLAYLGITAVGSVGNTTSLSLNINKLVDNTHQSIPALPLDAPVQIIKQLNSISVTPTNPSVIVGQNQQFTATGIYDDLSTANLNSIALWSSTNTTVATVNSTGLATSYAQGTAEITANVSDVVGTARLVVNAPNLISLAVIPANASIAAGLSQQFVATGTFTDGSSTNLTGTASWSSSNISVATINSAGLAATRAQGTAVITANISGVVGTAVITVNAPTLISLVVIPNNPSVAVGLTQQFTATANYTNGFTDVTGIAIWTSSNITVAMVDNAGLVTSHAQGSSIITANVGGMVSTAAITVNAPILISLVVAPVTVNIAEGLQQQFNATANYTNGFSDVTGTALWSSSDVSVVIVNNAGMATSIAQGTAVITANYGGIVGEATLTVNAPLLLSLAISPVTANITAGLSQQFSASGNYTNGLLDITDMVTWSSSNNTVATVDDAGLATSHVQGISVITVNAGGVVGTALLTVIPVPLVAETGIRQALNNSNVAVVDVNINRVRNLTNNATGNINGGIGRYTAMVSSNGSKAMLSLSINGVPPFNDPAFDEITGIFSVTDVSSPIQPDNSTVAELVPILTSDSATKVSLTVTFQVIGAAGQPGLNIPEERANSITLLRGDADGNGVVNIVDSLAIKQYLVGQLHMNQINGINAASPDHDGAGGDQITIVDALAIEQTLVHQTNTHFQ